MNIMISLNSDLDSEVVYQFLTMNGYNDVVVCGRSSAGGFAPQVLLVDITTLTYDFLAQYPQAKAFLIDDIGTEAEKLCATLGSCKTGGILPSHAGLRQVWIDNGSVTSSTTPGQSPSRHHPKGEGDHHAGAQNRSKSDRSDPERRGRRLPGADRFAKCALSRADGLE